MLKYKSKHTGEKIDKGIDAAFNAESAAESAKSSADAAAAQAGEISNRVDEVVSWFNAVIKPTLNDNKAYYLMNGSLIEITGGAVWEEGDE